MVTHSSILAWKIAWTEDPGKLSPWGHKESDMTVQMDKIRRELNTRSEQDLKVICSTPSQFSPPHPWHTWDNICFCIYQQIWCLALSMGLEYPPSWTHSKAYQPPWMPGLVSRKIGVERDQDTLTWGPLRTGQMAIPPNEQVPGWGLLA